MIDNKLTKTIIKRNKISKLAKKCKKTTKATKMIEKAELIKKEIVLVSETFTSFEVGETYKIPKKELPIKLARVTASKLRKKIGFRANINDIGDKNFYLITIIKNPIKEVESHKQL